MTEQIGGFKVEHLHGPEEIPYRENELAVLCLVRDGEPWVRSFIEHYFSLGAKHIVFLDHNSRDGTVSAASKYDGVTVLSTQLPFQIIVDGTRGQTLMRQYLIERFGTGRWSLCVDIDELFDYPYSDVIGLDSLLGYLNSKSYTAVTAHILDMFPENSLLRRTQRELVDPLREAYRFYDISRVERVSRKQNNLARTNNIIGSDEVAVALKGGIRYDIFGFKPWLTKYPLLFSDGAVRHVGPHNVHNARVSDFTCVLLHYKFHAFSLQDYWYKASDYKLSQRKHEQYMEVLEKNRELQLRRETTRELTSVNELLESGFLAASEDYVSWINAEEVRNFFPQADHQDRPRAFAEAFLESRRRERAKTLRVGRLERQLFEYRRQEQARGRRIRKLKRQLGNRNRKIQMLKSQMHRRNQRIRGLKERLRKRDQRLQRLKRREQRLTKRNYRLKQQLENAQASWAWKLAEMLYHVKTRSKNLRRRWR